MTQRRGIILILVIIAAVVLRRLAVRAAVNFLLGCSLFGGNLL